MHRFLLIWTVLTLSGLVAQAQAVDSLEASYGYRLHSPEKKIYLDSTLHNLHRHDMLSRMGPSAYHLGNTGSPMQSHFGFHIDRRGFDQGLNAFAMYQHRLDSILYIETIKPFSDIGYSIGSNQENIFTARHAQNIKGRFQFGASFRRVGSTGNYTHARVTNTGFDLYGNLQAKNNRYTLRTAMVFDRFRQQENGGIAEDFITFDSVEFVQPEFVETRLNESTNTLQKNFAVRLENAWHFGKTQLDSINDSLQLSVFAPSFRIAHEVGFEKQFHEFTDFNEKGGYYGLFENPVDTTRLDGFYRAVWNRVSLTHLGRLRGKENPWFWAQAGLRYDRGISEELGPDIPFQNLSVDFTFTDNPKKKTALNYRFFGYTFLYGYNAGDTKLEGRVSYAFKKAGTVTAFSIFQRGRAARIHEDFTAARTDWTYERNAVTTLTSGLTYGLQKHNLKVEARYFQWRQPLFFTEDFFPVQVNTTLHGLRIAARKQTRLVKGLYLQNHLAYQLIQRNDYVDVPTLTMEHGVFYKGRLFKGNMMALIGADVVWHTAFHPFGYTPVTGQWYSQRQGESAPPPMLNAHISVQVKSLGFFFRAQYLNQGLGKRSYYTAWPYPARQRSFAGGIRWRFYE